MNRFCLVVLLFLPLSTGCLSGPHARNGATIGALVGTPLGAIIGSQNGETRAGALVGGTIGALTGNNIGANIDDHQQFLRTAAQNAQGQMSIREVITLSQSGVGEDVIINQIEVAGVTNRPSTNDLLALKNAGVSDRVIQAMQSSYPKRTIPQQAPVIVEEHYWGPSPRNPFYDPYYYRHRRPCPPPFRSRRGTSISFSHRF